MQKHDVHFERLPKRLRLNNRHDRVRFDLLRSFTGGLANVITPLQNYGLERDGDLQKSFERRYVRSPTRDDRTY